MAGGAPPSDDAVAEPPDAGEHVESPDAIAAYRTGRGRRRQRLSRERVGQQVAAALLDRAPVSFDQSGNHGYFLLGGFAAVARDRERRHVPMAVAPKAGSIVD